VNAANATKLLSALLAWFAMPMKAQQEIRLKLTDISVQLLQKTSKLFWTGVSQNSRNWENKDLTDFHVHFGQYTNKYFYPQRVVDDLAERKITEAWISSTTSCIYCREQHPELKNQPNAEQIINTVNEEFNFAINHAKLYGIKIHPLYWVVPEFEKSGVCFENYFDKILNLVHDDGLQNHSDLILESVLYEGFKIHPRAQNWDFSDDATFELAERVFSFAEKHKLRILIHTGESENDFPRKFEPFIAKYSKCIVQLAHIKNLDEAIYILNNYANVIFDTAFSSQDNILKMQNKGFSNRLVYGSDFPINSVKKLSEFF